MRSHQLYILFFALLSCQFVGGFIVPPPKAIDKAKLTRSQLVQLFQQNDQQQGGRVRFSGGISSDATLTNPLDAFLSYLASDVLSIALGAVGLLAVVIHRWALLDDSADTLTVQTRTDLLATFACGSVLLNGITKLDVTTALAESVVLEGSQLSTPEIVMTTQNHPTISWGLESLLAATPAGTAILLQRSSTDAAWSIGARAGTVSSATDIPEAAPILNRVGSPGNVKETYLPTLQALPGKTEFPYLPSNTQLALLIPIENDKVLILGGNTAKSFSPRDVAWCRIIAERMGNV
jgi:hypothetical protein